MRKRMILFAAALCACGVAGAQPSELTLRQAVLEQGTTFRPATFRSFAWIPGAEAYAHVKGDTLLRVDARKGAEQVVITLAQVNEAMRQAGLAEVRALRPSWLSANEIAVNAAGVMAVVDIDAKRVSRHIALPDGAASVDFAPGRAKAAFTLGQNLYWTAGGADAQGYNAVTADSVDGIVNGQPAHRHEFGISKGTFWAPDGVSLAYYRVDESMVTTYPLVDITQRVGTAENLRYPMAGMASHHATVVVHNTATGASVALKTGLPADQYLTNIAWSPDSKSIYIAVVNRGQDHMWLNRYSAATGELEATLFEETDAEYVEPSEPMLFLENAPGEFLWLSRRDGWNHLYRYNIEGRLISQVTSGEWEVDRVLGVDAKRNTVYFTSTEASPIQRQVVAVNIKNGKTRRITTEPGTHYALFDSKFNMAVDFFSSATVPGTVALYDVKSLKKKNLITASNPYDGYSPIPVAELVELRNPDGTPLYGRIIRPADFDSTRKYPAVIYVYGGPHSQLVTDSWTAGARLWESYMANRGFVMFTLDNRGTQARGADFEQAIHRRLGDLEMIDQMVGYEYLTSLPYIDSERIGVHGWSYGGFMTTSLMLRQPGKFKAAVAGGPVTDWKYYEVMYGERYMDTPDENPEGYKNADTKQYAANLQGKLMLIHDDMDRTVVPQHSLTLIHEFVKQGKQVDFFLYPQHDHNVLGVDRVNLIEKIINYFEDNL